MIFEVGIWVVVCVDEDGKCWVEEIFLFFVYVDYEFMIDVLGL